MAKSNPTNRVLNRVLDRSDALIYLVDRQGMIGYANAATQAWSGMSLAELAAEPLAYHVEASQPASQPRPAQGLCPPPIAPASVQATPFQVWRPVTGGQEFLDAWAFGLPQGEAGQGILVIADPASASDQPRPAQPATDPQSLHTALLQVRNQLRDSLDVESLVGTSPFARRLRRQARWISASGADILVRGPQGSGKEHLARCLAARHQVAESALVPIHGKIADPPLIQQSISDARQDAHDLVLLLLDVDRLAPDAQAELLGFLELPGIRWRTLATCTEAPLELANDHRFSERLAHRLGTVTVELPPLAQRREDIPFLAQAIVERQQAGRPARIGGLAESTLELLTEFDWPENLNQLVHTLAAAAAVAPGPLIQPSDLPAEFTHALQAMRIGQPEPVMLDLTEYLAEIESELLQRALRQARGNKTQAAKQLNISRPRLLRRLQALGLDEFLANAAGDDEQLDPSAFEELAE